MKCLLLIVVLATACGSAAKPVAAPQKTEVTMRSYFLVLLRRGPAWTPEKTAETKAIFEGHMANIEAMAATGKLLIAGPIDAPPEDRTALAGIFLFDVATKPEVESLIANDPAIKIGRLVPEIHTWYGPAGLTYPGKQP